MVRGRCTWLTYSLEGCGLLRGPHHVEAYLTLGLCSEANLWLSRYPSAAPSDAPPMIPSTAPNAAVCNEGKLSEGCNGKPCNAAAISPPMPKPTKPIKASTPVPLKLRRDSPNRAPTTSPIAAALSASSMPYPACTNVREKNRKTTMNDPKKNPTAPSTARIATRLESLKVRPSTAPPHAPQRLRTGVYRRRDGRSPLKIALPRTVPTPPAIGNPPPKIPSTAHPMPNPTAPKKLHLATSVSLMLSYLPAYPLLTELLSSKSRQRRKDN